MVKGDSHDGSCDAGAVRCGAVCGGLVCRGKGGSQPGDGTTRGTPPSNRHPSLPAINAGAASSLPALDRLTAPAWYAPLGTGQAFLGGTP